MRTAQLAAAGVQRTSRVAVIPRGSPEAVTDLLAVMSCGIAAPLNPRYRKAEFLRTFALLKIDFLLAESGPGEEAIAAAAEAGIPLLRYSSKPAESVVPAAPEDVAVLMQTSGTMGEPRRVPLTHANLQASAADIRLSMQLTGQDRFLCVARLHHIAGLALVLASLSAGSLIYCAPELSNARFFDAVDQFRPTWFWAAPAMLGQMLPRAEARAAAGFAPLRFIRSGSASLPAATLHRMEAAFGVPILENYGMTEAAPQITTNLPPPARRKAGSAGVVAGPELIVADEQGQPLPPGEEGEILIRGRNVMSGYEEDPEANAAAFIRGWFRTGDYGSLDTDGFLFLRGRRREMINRGGEKIWPREVEEALLSHPAVTEAVVFAIPHPVLGEAVGAAVVLRADPLTESDLRRYVSARLSEYKVPARIVVTPDIPKGPGGKPRRHLLPDYFGLTAAHATVPAARPSQSPLTPLEIRLAGIWAGVLQLENISLDDDFFALGGDSFAANQLLNETSAQFGCGNGREERFEFFETPTIAGQARSLERAMSRTTTAEYPPEVAYLSPQHAHSIGSWQHSADRPPVFMLPWSDSGGEYLAHMARAIGEEWPFCILSNAAVQQPGASIPSIAEPLLQRLLAIQPEGPYVLGGHCFGAVVAYEMARQLQAMGRTVRLLVIVDAPRPGYPSFTGNPGLFLAGAAHYLSTALKGPGVGARLRFGMGALLRHFAKQNRFNVPSQEAVSPSLKAMRDYRPQPLNVPTLLLVSRDHVQTGSPLDRRTGWLTLIQPRPRFAMISGDHSSILSSDQSGDVAREIRAALGLA